MTAVPKPIIKTVLLCEMVKTDTQGKHMLVGVMATDLWMSAIPAAVSVSLYIELYLDQNGVFPTYIRYSGPSDDSAVIPGQITVRNTSEPIIIATPQQMMVLKCEGILKAEFSLDQEEWTPILTRNVGIFTQNLASPVRQ